MRRMRVIFAGALVLLLLIFSFNAYACLLPLFGVPQAAMGGSCADPQDQPVPPVLRHLHYTWPPCCFRLPSLC